MRKKIAFLLSTIVLIFGQLPNEQKVQFEISVTPESARAGEIVTVNLTADIPSDWHLYGQKSGEFYTATRIYAKSELQFSEFSADVTEKVHHDKILEIEYGYFEGKINFFAKAQILQDAEIGTIPIKVVAHYQMCTFQTCLPPDSIAFEINLPVETGEAREEFLTMISETQESYDDKVKNWMEKYGLFLTSLLVFLGGLALNLTPCIFPLIPITVSYFGGQATGKISKSFVLALFYVLGIAVTYSILGTVAASTGSMLGSALQKPGVIIFIALVLLALSLSMFGFYEIRIPMALANMGGKSRQGNLGALFMGLTVGIIAAPCIGPFVLSLLIFVAEQGNPLLGFWLFFMLSLGLGLPFLILGTFSGSISALPQSGVWMIWVRNFFGVVLVAMAVYFLKPLIADNFYIYFISTILFIGGIYLGFLEKSTGGKLFKTFRLLIGIGFIAGGAYFFMPEEEKPEMAWQAFDYAILDEAKSSQTAVILDFYADWCVPCKELDHITFRDEMVVERTKNITALKVNLTAEGDELVKKIKQDFNIMGVPTVIFLDKNGNEIHRFTGFVNAETFLEKLNQFK